MDNGKGRKEVALRFSKDSGENSDGRHRFRQDELYRIPAPLVTEIVAALQSIFSFVNYNDMCTGGSTFIRLLSTL